MIEKIRNMLAFARPLRLIERPDSLVVQDYRPTFLMAACLAGIVAMAVLLVPLLLKMDLGDGLWGLVACGLITIALLFVAAQQSIREVYHFDLTTDSYRFERQYVFSREVIDGSMSQFTGAYVKTIENDESESHHAVLQQEGMFLTGETEQMLRESTPIFNAFSDEERIVDAISTILSAARNRREKNA